ncbi:MAG: hypothetical protein RJA22_821 [Verrucomicrobiota bacterium]
MKRPLLSVALLYALGIAAGEAGGLTPATPHALLFLLSATAGLAGMALLLPRARPWLLGLLLPVAGLANLARHDLPVSPHDLRRVATGEAALVTVRGRLVATPEVREYNTDPDTEPTRRTQGVLEIESLQPRGQQPRAASGRIITHTQGLLPGEFHGDRLVEVHGVLAHPPGPAAPGQFDYQAYLRQHGIHFQLRVESAGDWRALPPSEVPLPWSDRFTAWARQILARGLPDDESRRLLWAMALGWKTALQGGIAEPFMRSGTMHVFAISGLHVALIAGILVLILRALRVPRAAAAWIIIPLLWFYTHATGAQASAIRATLMMTVVLAGDALRRPSDLLNSLSVAAFLLLLWDPRQLFQAGFQLSFSVVLCLALYPAPAHNPDPAPNPAADPANESTLHRRVRSLPLIGRLLEDPMLPPALRPRWRRWLDAPRRALGHAVSTSLVAWLGSIPLAAHYFNLFTPVSLVANLVVVPLSSAALAASLGSLAVGGLFPAMAELFNHAAWACMHLMIAFSQWTADWPGAWCSVRAPGAAGLALYYTLLLGALTGTHRHPQHRRWLAAAGALLGLVCAAGAIRDRASTRLTLLPLGGGQAVCVESPTGPGPLLIDCGDERGADRVVKPFLRSRGLDRLGTLVLTHGDIRHVGGAEHLGREFRIDRVITSPLPFRSTAYKAARAGATEGPCQRGDSLGPWTVLHPAAGDRFAQADDGSLVLRGTLGGVRVLLLSDLGKPGQGALLTRETNLLADLVIAGLPAQGEPLAGALLDAAQPSLIVVMDSLFPASARAPARLRERLAARGIPVLYTRETGGLSLELRQGTWRVRNSEGRVVAEHRTQPP